VTTIAVTVIERGTGIEIGIETETGTEIERSREGETVKRKRNAPGMKGNGIDQKLMENCC
jgi:hypothetical protein